MATNNSRPLSPHLQVYRPQITSVLSITHRATGVVLFIGVLILTFWLTSATYGAGMYGIAQAIVGSWIGQLVMWGVVFSLWYHLANGIRHLAWDVGWGFELPVLRKTGVAVVVFAVSLTVLTLVVAYMQGA